MPQSGCQCHTEMSFVIITLSTIIRRQRGHMFNRHLSIVPWHHHMFCPTDLTCNPVGNQNESLRSPARVQGLIHHKLLLFKLLTDYYFGREGVGLKQED